MPLIFTFEEIAIMGRKAPRKKKRTLYMTIMNKEYLYFTLNVTHLHCAIQYYAYIHKKWHKPHHQCKCKPSTVTSLRIDSFLGI